MKAYQILTIECPRQVGGASKAKVIAEKLVSRVGGLSPEEFKELTQLRVLNNQVTVWITDKETAERVLHWRHHMKQVLKEQERHRQVRGYMVHTTRPVCVDDIPRIIPMHLN